MVVAAQAQGRQTMVWHGEHVQWEWTFGLGRRGAERVSILDLEGGVQK